MIIVMNLKLNEIIKKLEGKIDGGFLNIKLNEPLILNNKNFSNEILFQKDVSSSMISETNFSNISSRQTNFNGSYFHKCKLYF